MIRFEDAQKIVKQYVIPPVVETVPLMEALNRVLAEDIIATEDMPPFDKSAMDGFACRRSDLLRLLTVKEVIAAGQESSCTIGEGECARIMTGAKLPPGADCVIKFEDTEHTPEGQIRFIAQKTSSNICYTGEDVHRGQKLIQKGTLITPRYIGTLAAMGYTRPKVGKRPQTGIFCTGNELVDANVVPGETQIRNSNGPQLEAQCQSMNIPVSNYGIAPDTPEQLKKLFNRSVAENIVTIVSGGVSVGDFDYMPSIIRDAGFGILFHGMKVKPGKRMLFAEKHGKFVFGLPGNPVSSMIQFEMLVKPFLLFLQGARAFPEMEELRLSCDYPIKNSSRTSFVPVVIRADNTAEPVEYHGSAHIAAYTHANGFMEIPEGISYIEKGQIIHARRL